MSGAGERTRTRILDVSVDLFAEQGFAATSTRQIAQAADVNIASIAYHFGGKQGLYRESVQRLHRELSEGWGSGFPPAGVSPLRWWVAEGWSFCVAHRNHIRLLMRHVLDEHRHPEVIVEEWSEHLLERGEMLIRPFRPDWSTPRLRMFLLSMQHLIVRWAIEDPEQLARMAKLDDADDRTIEVAVVDTLTEILERMLDSR